MLHDPVLVELLVEGHPADTELARGAEAVVVVLLEGLSDPGELGLSLVLGERGAAAGRRDRPRPGGGPIEYRGGKVRHPDRAAGTEGDATIDHVEKFADVAGPVVALE